jgi:hypothetical protein
MRAPVRTANALIASERLSMIEGVLLASGWTDDGTGGWLPPERYREAHRVEVGAGALHLRNAIQAQVMFDEIVVSRESEAA